MIDFYVGQKVVCVDASGIGDGHENLTEGRVYELRWVGPLPDALLSILTAPPGELSVLLVGVVRWQSDWIGAPEATYRATRFRPLPETDISVFEAMLAPAPTKAREPA